MKVAHVTATFPPYRGGTGKVCFHNARELARLGHEAHVFTAAIPGAPACEDRAGFTIHRLRPLLQVGNAPVLPQLLNRLRGFDVIHLHYPFFGGELSCLAAKLYRIPFIVTYHQDVFLSGIMGVIEHGLRHSLGRWTLRSASRLLFTSQDYGESSYVRPLLRGCEARFGELPNGVDPSRFAPGEPPSTLRNHYGLSPDDQVMLLVAGLDRAHWFKGVDLFIDALARLPQHIKAVIVGDGNMRFEYEARARNSGILDRLIFAGRVGDEVLPDYYRLADVTVLPSVTMGEAFGLVLVESLSTGTPIIASRLPGVRTVVAEGTDGFLVKPGDVVDLAESMRHLLSLSEDQRKLMGKQGRRKVEERYTWKSIGRQLETVYLQVTQAEQPADAQVSARREA